MEEKEGFKLDVELPEQLAEGTQVNLGIVSYSHEEFVLDFVRVIPGMIKGKVKSRLVLSPLQAKLFNQVLTAQLNSYEQQHGVLGVLQTPTELNHPKGSA